MQPTRAGWYWDPAGRPGLFRWWDGLLWTRHVTPDPKDPSPEPFVPKPAGADGRLHAAVLSFPALDDPWHQCPAYPGFAAAIGQERRVGRTGRGEYDALIVIGSTPDRFAHLAPAAVAEALCEEILGTFYPAQKPSGPAEVGEIELGGNVGTRLDLQLEVHEPALEFAREDIVLVAIDTGLMYASLPEVDDVLDPDEVVALLGLAE